MFFVCLVLGFYFGFSMMVPFHLNHKLTCSVFTKYKNIKFTWGRMNMTVNENVLTFSKNMMVNNVFIIFKVGCYAQSSTERAWSR